MKLSLASKAQCSKLEAQSYLALSFQPSALCIILALIIMTLSSCNANENIYRAIDIHDGDTINVIQYDCKSKCKMTRVRLVGLDCPEINQQNWGIEARDFVRNEINGKKLYLETGINPTDKYGRTLAYVFYCPKSESNCIKNEIKFLNQNLLRNGYAQIYIYPGESKYSTILKQAEYEARSQYLNIWHTNNGLELSPAKFRAKQKRKK